MQVPLLDELNCNRGGLAPANAKRGNTPSKPVSFQCRDKRCNDPGATCPCRVAEGGSTTMHIHPIVSDSEIAHGNHRDDGKSFIHFKQINIVD
jgi:hypothetical protein